MGFTSRDYLKTQFINFATRLVVVFAKKEDLTPITNHLNTKAGNPHKVTSSDVGLGKVENKNSAEIRSEITTSNVCNALGYTPISTREKGVANGVATLGSDAKVPSSQLPSYVDDVIEGFLYNNKFYKDEAHLSEITGEGGKIYVDVSNNKTYRWSGSIYARVDDSIALGETSNTAYRGDRGKTAYDHAVTTNTNPHKTTAADVGLGSVDNTRDVNKYVKGIYCGNIGYVMQNMPNHQLPEGNLGMMLCSYSDGVGYMSVTNIDYIKEILEVPEEESGNIDFSTFF